MNNNKNLGYGICGKKNVYSSKALLDNWREDVIASTSSLKEFAPTEHYQTVSRATHIDPKSMIMHPNILLAKTESVANLKARNKDGMPYSLLFAPSMEKIQVRIDYKYDISFSFLFHFNQLLFIFTYTAYEFPT